MSGCRDCAIPTSILHAGSCLAPVPLGVSVLFCGTMVNVGTQRFGAVGGDTGCFCAVSWFLGREEGVC